MRCSIPLARPRFGITDGGVAPSANEPSLDCARHGPELVAPGLPRGDPDPLAPSFADAPTPLGRPGVGGLKAGPGGCCPAEPFEPAGRWEPSKTARGVTVSRAGRRAVERARLGASPPQRSGNRRNRGPFSRLASGLQGVTSPRARPRRGAHRVSRDIARTAKHGDDVRRDVLVREESRIERVHAETGTSQIRSFRRYRAANMKAAASPAGVSCGYRARMSACVAPLAASSSRNSTLRRVPRTHGFPPRISALAMINPSFTRIPLRLST